MRSAELTSQTEFVTKIYFLTKCAIKPPLLKGMLAHRMRQH